MPARQKATAPGWHRAIACFPLPSLAQEAPASSNACVSGKLKKNSHLSPTLAQMQQPENIVARQVGQHSDGQVTWQARQKLPLALPLVADFHELAVLCLTHRAAVVQGHRPIKQEPHGLQQACSSSGARSTLYTKLSSCVLSALSQSW